MSAADLSERLTQFLDDYRRLTIEQGPVPRVERLSEVLGAVRASRRPAETRNDSYPPPARFGRFLDALTPALKSRRESGADLNLWLVAGLRSDEVRNAAVLAWLLSPCGSHGLGAAVLRGFIEAVRAPNDDGRIDLEQLKDATVVAEERPMGSDRDRVDLAIEGRDFVAFVEVKINAPFAPGQVANYQNSLARKAANLAKPHQFLITLTRRPQQWDDGAIRSITWQETARVIRGACRGAAPKAGRTAALQFCDHIQAFR